jgi:hypothetical protein
MPSLRSLLEDLEPPTIGNPRQVFFVAHYSNSSQNGGCCLLWTVPDGVSSVTFEAWGAGGDGPGARCCEFGGIGANSGNYAIRTIDATPGTQYRICAGGSGCQGCCCGISTRGLPSWVYDTNAGSYIVCGCGGDGGNNDITRGGYRAYTCCFARIDDCGYGDFSMAGTGSVTFRNQFCESNQYDVIAGGWTTSRAVPDMCAGEIARWGGDLMRSCPSFPSGAGTGGRAYGDGRCYGQHGAAGIVKISYN